MYACVCHAVTEDAVRACAAHGLRHVTTATRAGTGCGSCVNRLRGLCTDSTTASAAEGQLAEIAA